MWIAGTTQPLALTQAPGGTNLNPLSNFPAPRERETPGFTVGLPLSNFLRRGRDRARNPRPQPAGGFFAYKSMPRDGALILSDVREPTLTIVCERCGLHGRYNVKRLIAARGADAS